MSIRDRNILVVGVALAILMCLFPPFKAGGESPRFIGYLPLFVSRTYFPSQAELQEERRTTGFDFGGICVFR